jgi:hypothetical protein
MTWYSILKQERVKIVASIVPINYGLVKHDITTILRNYTPEYKDKPRLKEGVTQSMVSETRRNLTSKKKTEEEIEEQILRDFYDTDKTTRERTGGIERDTYPEAQIQMLAEVEERLDEFKDILSNLTFRTEKGAKERRIQNLLEATSLKPKFGESDEAFRERVIQTEGGIKVGEEMDYVGNVYEVGIELSKAKPKSMNNPLGGRSKTQFEFDKNPKDTLEEGEEFVLDVVLDYLEDAKDVVSEMNYAFANYYEEEDKGAKEVLRFSYDIISV